MSTNVSNVSTGKPRVAGAVFRAPIGTPLPSTATEALDAAFADLGYISEDGVTNENTRDTEEIKAWGGDVVAQPQTGKTDTFGMTFIERKNVEVLKAVYGDENVTGTLATGIQVRSNATELENSCWVIDQILSEGDLHRTVIPKGKITETGEVTYADGEVTGYESTITAFPHSEWEGDTHREYMATPSGTGNSSYVEG